MQHIKISVISKIDLISIYNKFNLFQGKLMNLLDRKLQYFLEICKIGNLNRAGEKIGLSQPALTTSMKKLEEELNMKLFKRERRGLTMTVEGKRFFEWLVHQESILKMNYRQHLTEGEVVRIGAAFFLLNEYLNPLMMKISGFDRKIQILSRPFRDLIKAVEDGLIDFAFIGWDDDWSSYLEYTKLFDCPCAIVGRRGKHDHIQDYDHISQLQNEVWVIETDASNDRWPQIIRDKPGTLVTQHHLFSKYLLSGMGVSDIEVHYFPPNVQKKLVYSLVPSRFTSAWYGIIHRKSLPENLKEFAAKLSDEITAEHRKRWPHLKNGSPKQIRDYINKLTRK